MADILSGIVACVACGWLGYRRGRRSGLDAGVDVACAVADRCKAGSEGHKVAMEIGERILEVRGG